MFKVQWLRLFNVKSSKLKERTGRWTLNPEPWTASKAPLWSLNF